ncbi:MAG: hypothetical protein ACREOD_08145 [Candidatus Dormibacteria bacterium]
MFGAVMAQLVEEHNRELRRAAFPGRRSAIRRAEAEISRGRDHRGSPTAAG